MLSSNITSAVQGVRSEDSRVGVDETGLLVLDVVVCVVDVVRAVVVVTT